jgi:hypothetical protein
VEDLKAGEVLVYTVDIKEEASTEELELTGLECNVSLSILD